MNPKDIREAVTRVEQFYRDKSNPGPEADIPVTARMEQGLKCRIESADGNHVYTDMPETVGGSATTGSPGWLMRAAVASCDATLLTMRAARLAIPLESVEVRVEARSDGRGMFLDEGVIPSSTEMDIYFKIRAPGVSDETIASLVNWVCDHAPVGNEIKNALKPNIVIEP
ncbi:MAG: OsmC family protein [Pseudomonadota bacterium]